MFKLNITLRNAEEARAALAGLQKQIDQSGLPVPTAQFLYDQMETTFRGLAQQMNLDHLRKLKLDRVLEGDGYRVAVRVRQGGPSSTSWLARLFGGR